MFKSTLFTAFFFCISLLICSSTATVPPACVLACINTQPTPSDYQSVCGSKDVQTCLFLICGDAKQAAVDSLKSTCDAAGHEVAATVTSATSVSKSASATSSGSTTVSTGSFSGTNASTTGSGPARTESAAGSNSNNAGSNTMLSGSMAIVLLAVGVFVL